MALSVRFEPELEARVEQVACRLGVSKSDVVKDALERTLRMKNPSVLLDQVRQRESSMDATLSETASEQMKSKLRAKHSG